MKKKRITNIAEAFATNASSSMFAAVEVLNRHQNRFRYQVTASLLLNAWNLALKAFNHKTNKSTEKADETELSESIRKMFEQNKTALGIDFIVPITSISLLIKFNNYPFSAYPDFVKPAAFSVLSANIAMLADFLNLHFGIKTAQLPEMDIKPVEIEQEFDFLKYVGNDELLNELSEGSLLFLQAIVNTASALNENKLPTSIVYSYPQSIFVPHIINNHEIIDAVNSLKDKALRAVSQPISLIPVDANTVNIKLFDKVFTEPESSVIGFVNSEFPGFVHSKSFKKLYTLAKQNTEMFWQKRSVDKNGERKIEGRFTKDVYVFLRSELTKAKESPVGPQIIQKSIFDTL